MVLLYSVKWEKLGYRHRENVIVVRVVCLDENGQTHCIEKFYEEWLGVCTGRIEKVVNEVKNYFLGCNVRYERLGSKEYRKVLPYFEERLATGKLDYSNKPFYKLYVDASVEDVGRFLNKRKIAYYLKIDWLVRIYIDLCTRYDTKEGFFYRWYDVQPKEHSLIDSFRMQTERLDVPGFKIAAFDLETISVSGKNRVPTGSDPDDRIVMISVVRWNSNSPEETREIVLYLNPCGTRTLGPIDDRYVEYSSETKMLNDFHALVQDCHVLTGYNINNFDIPCLFARLLWLNMRNVLHHYTSRSVGKYVIATFANKIVLDAYNYIHEFSGYDLSSFKLDRVAKTKLGGEHGKIPVDSVGIHAWYGRSEVSPELCLSDDRNLCHDILKPRNVPANRFGTFVEYIKYCLVDSDLVRRIFVKETILVFLISRANLAAVDVVQALHFGNSRFLLEVIKSYGTILGFFVAPQHMKNLTDATKFKTVYNKDKFQGALNFCIPETHYRDVATMDFTSMYPISLLSSNLCYGSSTILRTDEYLKLPASLREMLTTVPYRTHSEDDFYDEPQSLQRPYPEFDPERDRFVMVMNQRTKSFLPTVVEHFLTQRKHHQRLWKETKNVMHYNAQLCIKILINSLYGTMGSKNSPLGYLVVAMSIVTFARYQLLASYHYVQHIGYKVCYADTDSLMVHRWPVDNCDAINEYLNLPYVDLKFEKRMKSFLVLSKKRYVYESAEGRFCTKGLSKKTNGLIRFMSKKIIDGVMRLRGERGDPVDGWILWVETVTEANYMCHDPQKYSISRKTKKLEDYKSTSCASVRYLQKYPEKAGGYVEYAFSRADVAACGVSRWIMDAKDIKYVNFEQLIMNDRLNLQIILNIGFWDLEFFDDVSTMVINTLRWKKFMHAELLNWFEKKERIIPVIKRGIEYTFQVNDYHVLSMKHEKKKIRASKQKNRGNKHKKRRLN